MNKLPPTFIDTNILIYSADAEKVDAFSWINQLYEKVYVHKDVFSEININLDKIQRKITEFDWIIFDPVSEDFLDELQYDAYESFFDKVSKDFAEYQNTREHKDTVDTGDVSILTSCFVLGINLITSHDTDFQKVIPKNNYKISSGVEEKPDKLIEVHGLLELGVLLIEKGICKKKDYFKLLSAADIKESQRNFIKDTLNKKLA